MATTVASTQHPSSLPTTAPLTTAPVTPTALTASLLSGIPPGVALPTTAAPPTATHPPLPLICLPSRLRDPRVFSGLGDEDIEEWADFYTRVSLHNRWDDPTKLANVIFYLSDVAKTWFLNHEAEMATWAIFFSRIQEIFGRPEDRKAVARKKLATRSQLRSEGYTSYIEDVLTLCKKIDVNMSESERVRHVLKGIAEEAVHLFVLQPPANVQAIVTICQSLEAAQRQRIPLTTSLPAASDIPSVPYGPTFQDIVRKIVREELSRILGTTTTEDVASNSAPIRNLIRDELIRLNPNPPSTPLIAQPQPTYAEILRLPPSPASSQPVGPPQIAALTAETPMSQRPQATWRTSDNRPVCYYCGIPGHVSRYCRRRRSDESRNWPQQHRDSAFSSPPRYRNEYYFNRDYIDAALPPEASRRPARPRSPSPYRRRHSISPMNAGPPRTAFSSGN